MTVRERDDEATTSRQLEMERLACVRSVVMIIQNMGSSSMSRGSGVVERREDDSELCWDDSLLQLVS